MCCTIMERQDGDVDGSHQSLRHAEGLREVLYSLPRQRALVPEPLRPGYAAEQDWLNNKRKQLPVKG